MRRATTSFVSLLAFTLAACGTPAAGDAGDAADTSSDAIDSNANGDASPDAADVVNDDGSGPRCGDSMCSAGETCDTCAVDCGSCTTSVTIDPQVEASSDDAEENTATGAVNLTSSDLELTTDGAMTQIVGIRFHPAIPPNATITRAWVQFHVDEATTTPTTLTVQGEAVDDAATFTTTAMDISSRARTTASLMWSPLDWTTLGDATPAQRTPDLTAIVQEIIRRPGWVVGNHLAIVVSGTGWRVADSYDGSAVGAPQLHVEFDIPAGSACGNGTCDAGETCSSCTADCGACVTCGDNRCDAAETCSSCASDCGACSSSCGDGMCGATEHCFTCASDCGACTGTAPTLTRGPYLNNGSTDAVTVRWRTSTPTDSVVAYGRSAAALNDVVRVPGSRTEHVVRLLGLAADTRYYYAVGTTGSPLVGDTTYSVITAPATPRATRFWVIGDAGTAGSGQRAVRDAYSRFAGIHPTHLWLMLGDNAYVDGTDAQYQAAVFNMYPDMLRSSVVWPTLGNHDGHSAMSATQTGPYYDIFSLPTTGEAGGVASGTEAYYSFDYGGIHFVCLDSDDSDRTPAGPMLTWLRNDLMADTHEWVVAFWHHPPYSKGSHDSDTESQLVQMRTNVLPILESFGVDLVLCGHSHSYERSFYLNGHYGLSTTLTPAMVLDRGDGRASGSGPYHRAPAANAGAVYVVAGSSGMADLGSLDHPAMFVSLSRMGSLVVDVDGSRLDAQFISDTGLVSDTFSIEHR